MRAADIDKVRSQLQRRRRLVLEASRRTAGDIDQLRGTERDPEIEERSQSEQQQYSLSQIGEAEQREIAQIDAALQRPGGRRVRRLPGLRRGDRREPPRGAAVCARLRRVRESPRGGPGAGARASEEAWLHDARVAGTSGGRRAGSSARTRGLPFLPSQRATSIRVAFTRPGGARGHQRQLLRAAQRLDGRLAPQRRARSLVAPV